MQRELVMGGTPRGPATVGLPGRRGARARGSAPPPRRSPQAPSRAKFLSLLLARRGFGLVFGGGSIGLMGVVADAVVAAGGDAIAVILHGLAARELAPDMGVVSTMHARKALMAELADGFVALPGGMGTFELFEIATWAQLGIHHKPVGVLNVAGYYDPLVALLDHATAAGLVGADAPRLLDRMAAHAPPRVLQWVTPEEA